MLFKLYMNFNTDDINTYPYIAISDESAMHIHLCQEHINILSQEDSEFSYDNYLLTSRTFKIDLESIEKKVEKHLGYKCSGILTRFDSTMLMTLTYYDLKRKRYREENLFAAVLSLSEKKMVDFIFPMMQTLREFVTQIE